MPPVVGWNVLYVCLDSSGWLCWQVFYIFAYFLSSSPSLIDWSIQASNFNCGFISPLIYLIFNFIFIFFGPLTPCCVRKSEHCLPTGKDFGMESQLFFLPYKKQRKGSIFPIVIWFELARCCQKDFCSCQKDFSSSTPQFTQSFGQWDRLLWKFLFVPMGGSHGQRSLAGWGFKKPDTSEQLRAA